MDEDVFEKAKEEDLGKDKTEKFILDSYLK